MGGLLFSYIHATKLYYHPHLPLTLLYVRYWFLNALKRRTYYAIKRDYEKMWLKFDGLINIKIVFWFCLSRFVYIGYTLIFQWMGFGYMTTRNFQLYIIYVL